MKTFALTSILFLVSCSTIDRRSYFSPQLESENVLGPAKQHCGMHQFSSEPDAVEFEGLVYRANESYEPYVWGPWLVTVVPIFPITWIVDLFLNPKLSMSITAMDNSVDLPKESELHLSVLLASGKMVKLKPESVTDAKQVIYVTYPVKATKVRSLNIEINEKPAGLEFIKTARWSWTQICIN